jgi:hypothetical protein
MVISTGISARYSCLNWSLAIEKWLESTVSQALPAAQMHTESSGPNMSRAQTESFGTIFSRSHGELCGAVGTRMRDEPSGASSAHTAFRVSWPSSCSNLD